MKFVKLKTLSTKIAAPILGLTLLFLTILGGLLLTKNQETSRQLIFSRGESMANLLENISAPYIVNYDYPSLDSFVKEAVKDPEVVFMAFYDNKGKILTKNSQEPKDTSGLLVINREIKDPDSKSSLGHLKIGYSLALLQTLWNQSLKTIGGILLVGGIMMTAGVILLIRRLVGNRVNNIYHMFRQMVREGDLNLRVPMRQIDIKTASSFAGKDLANYGTRISCWQVIGSTAPGEATCPALISGKYQYCTQCPMAQLVLADEIDKMSAWINTFIKKFSVVIKELGANSTKLTTSSGNLFTLSGQMSNGIDHISGCMRAATDSSQEMNLHLSSVAAAMEEATTNLGVVAGAAEEMSATIREIAQRAEKARSIVSEGVEESEKAGRRMDELEQAAREIDNITTTITDISEQINLLALNATIEAARAGEAGRGFAVVANEVKALARQTAGATDEIKNRVEGIKNSSTRAIEEIGKVNSIVNEINNSVTSIATAVEEQAITTQEIAHNVVQASQGVQEVTGHTSQGSQMAGEVQQDITVIYQETGEISSNSLQVQQQAEELSRMAEHLNGIVKQFKV